MASIMLIADGYCYRIKHLFVFYEQNPLNVMATSRTYVGRIRHFQFEKES